MRRVPELDGLRALAATLIVAFHIWPEAIPWGWAAVDLFFVLSGFLITAIIIEHGETRGFLTAFYMRRGLRIWPPYFVLIAVLVVAGFGPPRGLAYFLTYTQQLPLYRLRDLPTGTFAPNWRPFNHSWTLAIEEQFYVLWPAAVLATGRKRIRGLALAVWAASVSSRALGLNEGVLLAHADGLALGALLASQRCTGDSDHSAWAIAAGVALLAATLAFPGGRVASVSRVASAALASYAAVAYITSRSGSTPLSPLRWRPVVYLGTIGYGFYLYHVPVIVLVTPWLQRSAPGFWRLPAWFVTFGLTFVFAAVSWHLLERPILRLKDRFGYQADRSGGRTSGETNLVAAPTRVTRHA